MWLSVHCLLVGSVPSSVSQTEQPAGRQTQCGYISTPLVWSHYGIESGEAGREGRWLAEIFIHPSEGVTAAGKPDAMLRHLLPPSLSPSASSCLFLLDQLLPSVDVLYFHAGYMQAFPAFMYMQQPGVYPGQPSLPRDVIHCKQQPPPESPLSFIPDVCCVLLVKYLGPFVGVCFMNADN